MTSKHLRPLKAIRAKCLDCQGGKPSLVRLCPDKACPLHFLRYGHNPLRSGIGGRRTTKDRAPLLKNPNSPHDSKILMRGKTRDELKRTSASLGALIAKSQIEPIKIKGMGQIDVTKTGSEIIIRLKTRE